MKKMRKFMALAITAIMVIATGITGFAVQQTANLTVQLTAEVTEDTDVIAYKLMDLYKSNNEYQYTVNPTYAELLKEALNAKDTNDIIEKLKIMPDNSTEVNNFVEKINKKISTVSVTEGTDYKKQTISSSTGDKKSTTFEGLAYGYYLVTTTNDKAQRTLVILDGSANNNLNGNTVSNGNETVILKEEETILEKKADKDSYEIGDEVKYTITTEVPREEKWNTFKFTDTLSEGLNFKRNTKNQVDIVVTVEGKEQQTIISNVTTVNGKESIEILLEEVLKTAKGTGELAERTPIKIEYSAILNDKAGISNTNEVKYGNNPGVSATVSTYPIQIRKINDKDALLAGVEFELFKSEQEAKDNTNAIKVKEKEPGNYVVDKTSNNTKLVTVDKEINGYNLKVNGLAAGTYYLKETKAPEGYNKLENPIKIEITKDGKGENWSIYKDGTIEGDKIIDIINKKGGLLPETGGMGTILFTVAGLALILMATFGMKKRKEEN